MAALELPPHRPLRPLHALASLGRMLKDPDNLKHVFDVLDALSDHNGRQSYLRIKDCEYGQRVIHTPNLIAAQMADAEHLSSLPAGAFGRVYYEAILARGFVPNDVTKAALDADSLPEFARRYPHVQSVYEHIIAAHDLRHILTGYETDVLGEACLLAFDNAQMPDLGVRTLAFLLMIKMKQVLPLAPVIACLKEAEMLGRRAKWLASCDLGALFALPLEQVRANLLIGAPKIYLAFATDDRAKLDAAISNRSNSDTAPNKAAASVTDSSSVAA
jgi:ubiquinone biosynthesis protein COQ4